MTVRAQFLLFDDVELLDFCGPYEVLSAANQVAGSPLFHLETVSHRSPIRTSRQGLSVNTDTPAHASTAPDWLLVPGGVGARALVDEAASIAWLTRQATAAKLVLSVCTGALLLAKAGLLTGLRTTTHHSRRDLLAELAPDALVTTDRFTDNGKFVLSAGISAGIDMTLHVLAREFGPGLAEEVAQYMEYDKPQSGDT